MQLTRILLSGIATVATQITLVTATAETNTTSTPPINITGNAFLNSATGERFYIRGIDYQPGGSSNLTDPLADSTICGRDIPLFQDLGINAVRVYTIDNSLDHSVCMKMLQDAGIYLILDVNTPKSSISRIAPACSYNADYLQNIFATIDSFAEYNNTLGFFAGNEVINSENTTAAATYVKAVVRDMKKYIKARNYRTIPVGYSAADISSNRLQAAEYFNCGDDEDARIDMFGVNDYSWCGRSSYQVSGYAEKVKIYTGYSLPIFLSEFGCNKVVSSRPFTEIQAIYSTRMSSVFSGGLVYEYSNETNNYGLVQIESDTSIRRLPDFYNLKAQYSSVSDPVGDGGYSTSNKYSTCPAYEKGIWEANNTLPEMPSAASAYFTNGAGTAYGTNLATQNDCYKDEEEDYSSSSSESSESSTSSSTSSSNSNAISSKSSDSSSSTSHSSKSKGIAGSVQAPLFAQIFAQIWILIL